MTLSDAYEIWESVCKFLILRRNNVIKQIQDARETLV